MSRPIDEVDEKFYAESDADDTTALAQEIVDESKFDPNFPPALIEAATRFLTDEKLKGDPIEYPKILAELQVASASLRDNSAYPEVRAVVSNTDDPSTPVSTIRAWVIGLMFAAGGSACNQFFHPRQPSITISVYTAQVLAYPLGKLWERFMPNLFSIPIPFSGGKRLQLNPGHFTQKEHMLITIMANVSFGSLYTTNIYIVQILPKYFNQHWARSYGYQVCTSLSVQLLGYGLAGITRRFLVYPASCIWPTTMGTIALNRAFHHDTNLPANGWKISRLRFFGLAFSCMFCYFWFPNMIFPVLSTFNWITWIAPNNINLGAMAGSVSGLGLNPWPTFDWNRMRIDPIINPLFSTINQYIGACCSVLVIAAMWYSNSFNTGYLGINTNRVFDRHGQPYQVSLIIDSETGLLNVTAYRKYSPAYLAAGNLWDYVVFFAIYTATITYAFLYQRHEIAKGFKSLIRREANTRSDVHNRLMRAYPEVPEWWYAVLLLVAIVFGLVGLLAYPTRTSVSSLFFGILLAIVFVVPIGIMYAIANVEITLNVLAEFVGGAAYPGNYLAMLFFKSYGYDTCAQAVSFASDLKLGHYTKIPPRVMFSAQTVATVVGVFVQISIVNWQINSISDLCAPHQADKLTCPGVSTFFTAAVLWGTIGPKNIFGVGKVYNPILWAFLVGAVLPVPVYIYLRRNPNSWVRYVHIPAILNGMLAGSPYNLSYWTPVLYVGFFFNFFIRRRFLAWWSKYAYILTTAFSVGIALSAIFQFIVNNQSAAGFPAWWGTTIPNKGCDGGSNYGCMRLTVPADGFGPAPGEY